MSMSAARSRLYKRMTFLALSCVFLTVGFSSGQSIETHDQFRLVQDRPWSKKVCSLDPATQTLGVRSSLECSKVCRMNSKCNNFNYLDHSKTCQIYAFLPFCFGEIESCRHYQKHSDQPLTGIPAENCSLPYTYGGQLYYGCSANLTGVGCSACLTQNRTITTCTQLLSDTVSYVAQNIAVPTQHGYTSVVSINGWIVVQQRVDGSLSFDQNWAHYKTGFGSPAGNFWLGLDRLFLLTTHRRYRLRVEVQSTENDRWFSAEYESFVVGSEATGYALKVAGYVGDAGDALNSMIHAGDFFQNGMKFSTSDKDNDLDGTTISCAVSYIGGFWFNACFYACLNCKYGTTKFGWYTIRDLGLASSSQLKTSRMMIRPS